MIREWGGSIQLSVNPFSCDLIPELLTVALFVVGLLGIA